MFTFTYKDIDCVWLKINVIYMADKLRQKNLLSHVLEMYKKF